MAQVTFPKKRVALSREKKCLECADAEYSIFIQYVLSPMGLAEPGFLLGYTVNISTSVFAKWKQRLFEKVNTVCLSS